MKTGIQKILQALLLPGLILMAGTGLFPLSVAQAAELSIAEGVTVKFGPDAGITVRDTLRTGEQVRFTSLKDDTLAGQTGLAPQTPAAGDWRGIQIEASAAFASLKLQGSSVKYSSIGIDLRKISPTINFLSVSHSLTGVRITHGAAPRFDGLSLANNAIGMEVDVNAAPIVSGSSIQGNNSFGIINRTPSTLVQATGNWWGDASGPNDPVANAQGKGDKVSTGVNYGAWRTEIPLINPQIRVAGGITFTGQPQINLLLSCTNALEYRVAENNNFSGVAFVPMAANAPFTLSSGDGVKQLSAQYRASTGNIVTATLAQGILYDTQGPSLSVTNPAAGSYLTGSITISATASDPAGVLKVEFFIDDVLAATKTGAPYNYAWDVTNVADGSHSIRLVAHDTVGHSSVDTRNIILTKAGPPPPDTSGPSLSNLKLAAIGLINGSTITQSGTLTVTATDPSGISRIEFLLDGVLFATDTNGADGYSAYLDIIPITDGHHSLTLKAYDSLNNLAQADTAMVVALAAPAVPILTAPVNGLVTNQTQVTVAGSAEKFSQIMIHNNGPVVAGPLDVDAQGKFSLVVNLAQGANSLQAAAMNRGGASALTAARVVTVDASIPPAPLGLNASAQAAGKIRLTWNRSTDINVTGYYLYRSTLAFTSISEATKVNASPLAVATTAYDDVPTVDGTYYYRLVAVNKLGTASLPSNQTSAVSDNSLPKAVQITYAPSGKMDATSGRTGVGRVDVTVKVNEPLLAPPFLSIAPQNGVPIAVELIKNTETEYRGFFTILPTTPSGIGYAVFSARDLVGNRGTEIAAGASLNIDAQGPALTAITLTPGNPIKNEAANPVSVTLSLTFSEANKPSEAPQLNYILSSAPLTEVPISTLTQVDSLHWTGSFTLPAAAGANQIETLKFSLRALDDLDNVSTTITAANSFQVYQGELPPLTPPLDFTGTALPGGKVKLTWRAVASAAGYLLYRQAPGESALSAYQRVATVEEFVDNTSGDGLYRYTLASIRQENGQEALSAQTLPPVEINADASAPNAPQNFVLTLVGQGIQAIWEAPAGGGVATYRLYRSSEATITGITGLTPIKTGIKQLGALDAVPSLTEHAYAVTAVDAAGNESPVSNSAYLNAALLPVATLSVVQSGSNQPVISWTHIKPAAVAGYDVYLGPDATRSKLNPTPLSGQSYTDTGWSQDERRYTVVAFDNNATEIGRSLRLPKLSAQLIAGAPIKRGLMNRLQYQVINSGGSAVSNVVIKAKLGSHEAASTIFSLAAGETKLIPVIVGGFADIPNRVTLTSTVLVTPNEGEKVEIIRSQEIDAQEGSLVLSIATESFTRGGIGKARFTLENTSDVEMEVLTALSNGNQPSNEMRYKLLDKDGNVLATQSVLQFLGDKVVTLTNGKTVARLPAGASFTSNPVNISVPSSAPDSITVQLDIDKLHYHLGQADAVSIQGLSGRAAASLIDSAYYGEVTNISPQSSFGDQDIVITGRAIARASTQPLASVPLKLVLNVNGFERVFDIFTNSSGGFTYTFKPTPADGGSYKVSVVHPDIQERPLHGSFVINSVTLQYASYALNTPRNYPFTVTLRATAGEGTQATNVRFAYEAQYQPLGTLPAGLSVTTGAPISLGSKQSADLTVTVSGDNSAQETGSIILKVLSDEHGGVPIGSLRVDYRLTDAKPALYASPSYVQTGVSLGSSVTEQVSLENRGFSEAQGVTLALLNADGSAPPSWMSLITPSNLGNLAVGEKRGIDIAANPPTTLTEGIYQFLLRIASANAPGGDINVYVSVTQSGEGNVLFKASDIYTATLDQNGKRIPGLAGARIQVQNESVISVSQTLTTDSFGEAYFQNLPAGRYKFRATALNHQEVAGRFSIKPGVTVVQDIFLDYNLVTVEWSVNEITIQDKYEIVLNATFETNVPAAVVVMEPASVSLPNLKAGDVYYGELTLTNYGLVRADNVRFTPPGTDAYVKYEFLTEWPSTVEAKQRITIPYRITSIASFEPTGTASGGGCFSYARSVVTEYQYTCANGVIATGRTQTVFSRYSGTSCSGGGAGGGSTGGGGIGGGGAGGIGGGSGGSYTPLPNAPFCGPRCNKSSDGPAGE